MSASRVGVLLHEACTRAESTRCVAMAALNLSLKKSKAEFGELLALVGAATSPFRDKYSASPNLNRLRIRQKSSAGGSHMNNMRSLSNVLQQIV